jgi:hypothetical protein
MTFERTASGDSPSDAYDFRCRALKATAKGQSRFDHGQRMRSWFAKQRSLTHRTAVLILLRFRRTDSGIVTPLRKLEGSGGRRHCNPDERSRSIVLRRTSSSVGELELWLRILAESSRLRPTTEQRRANVATETMCGQARSPRCTTPSRLQLTRHSSVTSKLIGGSEQVSVTTGVGYRLVRSRWGPAFNVSLSDTLPAGCAWSTRRKADAGDCSLSQQIDRRLTCAFGDSKGHNEDISSWVCRHRQCPGITTQCTPPTMTARPYSSACRGGEHHDQCK